MKNERELAELAQEIDSHLRAIRRTLRKPLTAAITRGDLTALQRGIMHILVRAEGLCLMELSRRAELARSTVSGIVYRLEKHGMVIRQPDSEDGRFSRIAVTDPVRSFVRDKLPELTMQPLLEAVRRARPGQRAKKIITGLRTLHRALDGA